MAVEVAAEMEAAVSAAAVTVVAGRRRRRRVDGVAMVVAESSPAVRALSPFASLG